MWPPVGETSDPKSSLDIDGVPRRQRFPCPSTPAVFQSHTHVLVCGTQLARRGTIKGGRWGISSGNSVLHTCANVHTNTHTCLDLIRDLISCPVCPFLSGTSCSFVWFLGFGLWTRFRVHFSDPKSGTERAERTVGAAPTTLGCVRGPWCRPKHIGMCLRT